MHVDLIISVFTHISDNKMSTSICCGWQAAAMIHKNLRPTQGRQPHQAQMRKLRTKMRSNLPQIRKNFE